MLPAEDVATTLTTLGRRGVLTVDFQPPELDPIDGQKPSDHCAVVGVKGKDPVFNNIFLALKSLQHRGQESAGIATFDDSVVNVRKDMGLVSEVFNDRNPSSLDLEGNVGIGHTRYSTAGTKSLENSGPFIVSGAIGYVALSHNGEITNADPLREELKKKGATFLTSSDTEVMLMEISRDVSEHGIYNGFKQAVNRLRGAYSAAIMINERLFALRDPYGIRPLILGKVGESYVVASESCVFDVLDGEVIKDVLPGELIEITEDGPKTVFRVPAQKIAHCMFEYAYFARPDSVIDKVEVFGVRIRLGERLATEHPVDADVVIPVPDSGRAQALGYSQKSKIPYSEGLIKNRYSERTFIMPTQQSRNSAIRMKLNPIKSAVEGKRVVLVDDSIVRGNTMKRIIGMLKKTGVSEVHVRVGCPEIVAPCYFGVDMKTKDQFIATSKTVEEIRKEIGADSLGYISIEGLVESITISEESLCLGCLTGKYPTSTPYDKMVRQTELENY